MIHDIKKLPKWVQYHIRELEIEIERRNSLVKAHSILCEEKREWFTIINKVHDKPMKLWILNTDNPFPVCSIGKGDILLIGRAKNV